MSLKVLKPIDFFQAINQKDDIRRDDPQAAAEYDPYRVNKLLSLSADFILYVNEMNFRPDCDSELQFDFFLHALSEGKGRIPNLMSPQSWADIEVVKEYYGYSTAKAKVALSILNQEELEYIKNQLFKGGFQ